MVRTHCYNLCDQAYMRRVPKQKRKNQCVVSKNFEYVNRVLLQIIHIGTDERFIKSVLVGLLYNIRFRLCI